jgi:leader peptidase (prepilin peptidase)/N-methyltransferase
MAMDYLFSILIFFFGLCVGSFLNVVICRLDSRESILFNRSHCPKCGRTLQWHDLIPLLSFFLLKRKCRYCGKKISWQYPLVEMTTALSFLLIFNFQFSIFNQVSSFKFQVSELVYYFLVVSSLIIISAYDLKHYLIPDEIIYPAITISLIVNLLKGFYCHNLLITSYQLLIALLAGAGFFLLLFLVSKGKWMGLGDVKLAAFLGLLLGWPSILLALSISFFLGAVVGLILILLKKKKMSSQIPFGPFLSAGALIALFWGSWILSWYWGIF